MIAFVIRRLLQAVLVMLAVGFVGFSLFAYVGDPVSIMLGQDYTQEARQRLIQDLGLDQPFFVQYARFIAGAAQGEFGISYRLARPVSELLLERLPATLELSFCAAVLALAAG
ncbi:MAG: ABC transporter permease, partial [Alphaproteobacteria bacterium]|nr:ABC transporter permease [Alphaproteobacteria bacterium]